MAFNRDAFLASFLNQMSAGIVKQREDAEEYKEQEEDAYERNKQLIATRNARASQAVALGRQALQYLPEGGNSKAMVRTAIASGMTGVQEFRDKLAKAHAEAGLSAGERLAIDDVEAIISMPNIPSIDQSLIDGSLEKFAKQTYGAMPIGETKPVEDDTSVIGQLFGFGAKDRVKRELAERNAFDGMSVADVNAAARLNEFNSLIPNAVMSFAEMERFGRNESIKFVREITDAHDTALTSKEADDAATVAKLAYSQTEEGKNASPTRIKEVEDIARKAYAQRVIKRLIETEAGIYGDMLLKSKIASDQIKQLMGESYYFNLYDDYVPTTDEEKEAVGLGLGPSGRGRGGRRGAREQEETTAPEVTEETTTTEEDTAEPETPTPTEDETPAEDGRFPSQTRKVKPLNLDEAPGFFPLSKYRKWTTQNEGKYDLETGDPIYVRPRPPEGGPKKRYPLFPGSTSSRKTEPMTDAEYWDMQHADTHEPSGYPKGAEFIE